jgi:hypothetical protein
VVEECEYLLVLGGLQLVVALVGAAKGTWDPKTQLCQALVRGESHVSPYSDRLPFLERHRLLAESELFIGRVKLHLWNCHRYETCSFKTSQPVPRCRTEVQLISSNKNNLKGKDTVQARGEFQLHLVAAHISIELVVFDSLWRLWELQSTTQLCEFRPTLKSRTFSGTIEEGDELRTETAQPDQGGVSWK